jgi:hypothetical protein
MGGELGMMINDATGDGCCRQRNLGERRANADTLRSSKSRIANIEALGRPRNAWPLADRHDDRRLDRCPLQANLKCGFEHALTIQVDEARAVTANESIDIVNGHPDLESTSPARSQLELC